ncbi:lysine-tRNA ligase [Pneumocystis carinii B80]|uniref:Lysine--tRNA ligase n=1 Tax=Pneumocystis carinii (strain B80) TaxID=1408658 RepID=A0A0W4ZPN4_PNEC8|nr:lysine-tRNA ligase [Pneumocystis carinii B80]KTW30343.1 lysine-tRNA ligase [Pneumocystis carinii B80]
MLNFLYKKNLREAFFTDKYSFKRWLLLYNYVFFARTLSITRKQGNKGIEDRLNNFYDKEIEPYPRIQYDEKYIEICSAIDTWKDKLKNGERVLNGKEVTIRGRIFSIREASSKLFFYDIYAFGAKIQSVCSLRTYKDDASVFLKINKNLRRGDIVEMTGILGKTNLGEFSIFTSKIQLLAPCLHSLPTKTKNVEKHFKNRPVDFLIHSEISNSIILRSKILTYIRKFLLNRNFLEVETPILSGSTGGANARPFYTHANSLDGKRILLRIAPELWLKKLVIGGFDKVFEIGKCFRNEGLDSSHNPEFTICEFYQTYISLNDLIEITKSLLSGLINELINNNLLKGNILSLANNNFFNTYKILDFIPSLENRLGINLPNLDLPSAVDQLLNIANQKNISLSKPYTVNRILDQFSTQLLVSQCNHPTFIIHHPQIMSPLSKSSTRNNQKIAYRGELYILKKEICNFYEEENAPLQQYSKFLRQQQDRDHLGDSEIQLLDSTYINALEWALPPTGGCGIGIDRLCMLFSNQKQINPILTFGNLKSTCSTSTSTSTL